MKIRRTPDAAKGRPGEAFVHDQQPDRRPLAQQGPVPPLVIAKDDRVVVRVVGHGMHLDEFQGVEATGRHVTASGIGIARIADGRIVEAWAAYDA